MMYLKTTALTVALLASLPALAQQSAPTTFASAFSEQNTSTAPKPAETPKPANTAQTPKPEAKPEAPKPETKPEPKPETTTQTQPNSSPHTQAQTNNKPTADTENTETDGETDADAATINAADVPANPHNPENPTLLDAITPDDSELSRANTELLAKNAELTRQIDDLTTQVNVLTQERSGQLFAYGAITTVLAMLLGFILAKLISRQRW